MRIGPCAAQAIWKAGIILVITAFALVSLPSDRFAAAQERVQRSPSILEFFGLARQKPEKISPAPKKQFKKSANARVTKRKKSTSANPSIVRGGASSTPFELAAAPVEKLENAKTVLVVGDFMAGGLAEGLVNAFSSNAGVRIIEKWNGSSGFVRGDFYDWPANMPALLSQVKPAVVIVMIGANDRQQMKVGENRELVGTPAWISEYEKRVTSMAAVLNAGGVPSIWVGQPAFRSNQMSTSMTAFNDIYRKNIESVGGVFVDIWDGFVDENGVFQQTGPDMNGLPARLRGNDGISFARAGKRKAAFYVEKTLRQLLGDTGEPLSASLPSASSAGFIGPLLPAPVVITRTDPIGLNDPELDGGTELLGADPRPVRLSNGNSAARLLRPNASSATPRPGRVDDFTLRNPQSDNDGQSEPVAPESTGATR